MNYSFASHAVLASLLALTATPTVAAPLGFENLHESRLLLKQSQGAGNSQPSGLGRTPGTTRPPKSCVDVAPMQLTAIVSSSEQVAYAQSNTDETILWFYIPYTESQLEKVEFQLWNDDESEIMYGIYSEDLEGPGFLRVTIPVSQLSIVDDKEYPWRLKAYCDTDEIADLRIRSSITWTGQNIEKSTVEEVDDQMYDSYILNHLWYDAINLLIEDRLSVSGEVSLLARQESSWLDLLTSIHFDDEKYEYLKGLDFDEIEMNWQNIP